MKCRQSRRVAVRSIKTNRSAVGGDIQRLEPRCLFASVATFPFAVSHFVEDPAQQVIYATEPDNDMVAVIDATTLTVTDQIPVGLTPQGLALSADGSTLYVADNGANTIDVIDTGTLTAGTPLTLPSGEFPQTVQIGTNNRLWVLTDDAIMQIDATTGASTGPNLTTGNGLTHLGVFTGDMRVSADGTSLYYEQFGSSPSNLYKYNVSGPDGSEVWAIASGSNGQDLQLSEDGTMVAAPNGAPYDIPIYSTTNASILGTLNTGAFPSAFAFSPDDKVGYAVAESPAIQIYNLTNYTETNGINTTQTPTQLFVDQTGAYLFASEEQAGITQVFATGRLIPVPPTVTTQPISQEVSGGSSVSFTAAASGTPSPTVQWQESSNGGSTWTNINGATSDTLSIPQAAADAGYEFEAVFTNAGGSATSNPATLTVVTNGKLAFAQQPTGTVSGSLLTPPIIVDVEDSGGNLLASDNSMVTLSIASGPGGATLVGGGETNAIDGVATFPALSLPVAGTYVLKASDGVLTPGLSTSFISTGVPRLVFVQQPTATTAGTAISPPIVVDIDSAAGPLATTDDSIVTLSILSGPTGAELGGSVTLNAVNGVATFPDVVPTEPGNYTIEATDTSDTPATSTSFQVAQAPGGATTTTLTSNVSSIASASPVTFTANVAAANGTPTGTVQFFDDGVSIGMESLSSGVATLTTADLPAGVQYITAAYFGTAGYSGSTSSALVETVASKASLGASVSGSGATTLVPGNPGSVDVTIVNQGDSPARGVVGIQLYATTDGVATDGVAIAAHPTQAAVQLRGGKSKTVRLSFTVPSTLAPGSYTLMAVLTPMRGLTAANISATPEVASPFAASTVSLSFGTVGTHHGVKLIRTEPDGTVVTYSLSGPGTGTLSGNGITSPDITLTGTTSASHLSITTRGGSGGLTLAGLSDDSSVGAITAPTTTLDGVLEVQGSVGQLVFGSLTGSNLAAANFNSVLIEGPVANSNLLAGTNFGANGVPGGGDDTYAAGAINSIRILGNVTASILAAGLNPVDGIYLNGNDVLLAGGRIGMISISGSLSSDSRVLASSLPKTALLSGAAVNTSSDARFSL